MSIRYLNKLIISSVMILRGKVPPLDARDAMGYRGKLGHRSCFFCGTPEERNFDLNGKLQMLKVVSRDKNFFNELPSNHAFKCANPNCKRRFTK